MEKGKISEVVAQGGPLIKIEQTVYEELGYKLHELAKNYTPEAIESTMRLIRDIEQNEAEAFKKDGIRRANPVVALIKAYNRAKAADIGRNRGKASVGIKSAIKKLKQEQPNAQPKQIWFELLNMARSDEPSNEIFASDGNCYALAVEDEHLENLRVISCEAVTGVKDGVGLQQRTFNNNFKNY